MQSNNHYWRRVKIADVANVVGGGTPSTNNCEFWNGDIVWLSPTDLPPIGIISTVTDSAKKITSQGLEQSSAILLPKGTVVYSSRASIGKIGICDVELATNQGFVNFICGPELDQKYLAYVLLKLTPKIENMSNSTTFKEVSRKSIKSLEISLPPLEEQKRIASLLDQADALRRKRRDSMELLERYTQSIFLDIFGDPLMNSKGWKIEKLNDVCDVRDGTHDSPKYHTIGYPLVTSKNVKGDYIDFSTAKLISKEDFDDISRRSAVDNGDIIMPMIGTIGNPVIVEKDREFAIKNVALIKFTKSPVLNIFVKFLLGDRYLSHQIQKKSRGGTQKFLSLSDIRNLEIPVPDLDLQKRFASVYANSKKIKSAMSNQLDELNNQFNALMQKSFS